MENRNINSNVILIVEDDHMLNRVMSLQLQLAGFSSRSALDGREALKMIDDSLPSLLILDLGLPDMSGEDLLNQLRKDERTASLPLIVHTSMDLTDVEKERLNLGPSKFVTKSTAYSDNLAILVTEMCNSSAK